MPPGYVKPYVKRNKHSADAEAVCEAVRRPSMRFVPVKTPGHQAALVAHSIRDLWSGNVPCWSMPCGHLAEFGIVGCVAFRRSTNWLIADESDRRIPASARNALRTLAAELAELDLRSTRLETEIVARAKKDAVTRRLATIPGIGPIILRLSAMVPNPGIGNPTLA